MLCPRHRQTVTGYDNHAIGIPHQECRIIRTTAAMGFLRPVTYRGSATLAAEAAKYDREKWPVHGFAHDIGQNSPGTPYQRSGNDKHGVAKGEADSRRRPAGI